MRKAFSFFKGMECLTFIVSGFSFDALCDLCLFRGGPTKNDKPETINDRMHLKDYYQTLELKPSATLADIKTAYRRLAQLYHPDKNQNDPYAAALFEEIKEAYEVLSNPSKKDHYLQRRWYTQSTGSRKTATIITPVTVLQQALELDKYVSTLDVHRMDKEGLYNYITAILPDETLEKLSRFDEPAIKQEIVRAIVRSSRPLLAAHFLLLSERLKRLTADPSSSTLIDKHFRHLRSQERWEKYKPWLLLIIATGICILIFLAAGAANSAPAARGY
jgi:curved DNA-binding protein CbpA